MRAGRLNQCIAIEQETRTENAMGELVPAWTILCTAWAEKKQLTGRERFVDERLRADVDTDWRIRYQAGLAPKTMRVTHAGAVFDLIAVLDPDGAGKELHLLTLQQVG